MKKRIIEWLIKHWLKGYHLHLNPSHIKSDFVSPPPEFSTEGKNNE